MKFLVIIAVVVGVVSVGVQSQAPNDQERLQKIQRYREECVRETHVDSALIQRADKGEFVDDPQLKCFSKCFYQKAGFVNDKGEILEEVIKAKIPFDDKRDTFLAALEKCKNLTGNDSCDTVFRIHKCYYQETHQQPTNSHPQP